MAVQIQVRRDTAANWTSANPTLAIGEIGYETDTGKLKIGTGATAWNSLAYYALLNAFVTIDCPSGTDPVADATADTLTLTSSDGSFGITGNSTTDTIDFTATAKITGVASVAYLTGTVTVGTTEVEAKVGGSALSGRISVRIYNRSSNTIFFGPTGLTTTTGEDLAPGQSVELRLAASPGLFLIAAGAGNTVVVQELS